MRNNRVILALALIFLATGCARKNPFETRFREYHNVSSIQNILERQPNPEDTSVEIVSDQISASKKMAESGYLLIGESIYAGRSAHPNAALQQGKNIPVEKVLFQRTLVGSNTNFIPIFKSNPSYTSTRVYGSQGQYLGSFNTTSHNNSVSMVPVRSNAYLNWATYWVKGKPPILEAYCSELPDEAKYEAETSRGGYVFLIVEDSPAYKADIVIGDVITKINGERIDSPKDISEKIVKYAGENVKVDIIRKGEPMEVDILLNPAN